MTPAYDAEAISAAQVELLFACVEAERRGEPERVARMVVDFCASRIRSRSMMLGFLTGMAESARAAGGPPPAEGGKFWGIQLIGADDRAESLDVLAVDPEGAGAVAALRIYTAVCNRDTDTALAVLAAIDTEDQLDFRLPHAAIFLTRMASHALARAGV